MHYKAPDVLWSCLTDVETYDWPEDLENRCTVINQIADIMSSLDQKCLIYDKIAHAWLLKYDYHFFCMYSGTDLNVGSGPSTNTALSL